MEVDYAGVHERLPSRDTRRLVLVEQEPKVGDPEKNSSQEEVNEATVPFHFEFPFCILAIDRTVRGLTYTMEEGGHKGRSQESRVEVYSQRGPRLLDHSYSRGLNLELSGDLRIDS